MTLRGAIFLGIGAMVGAGIFALLGEAGAVAGAGVWISFLIAGGIALTLGYALVKLGVQYPSSGGLVTYLVKGFGNGHLVGVAGWLGYLTAIVVVGAMVAVSFGDYAASLFLDKGPGGGWTLVFAALVVAASAFLTVIGPRWVERAQTVIVVALLAVFGIFVVATLGNLHPHLLAPSGYPSFSSILSATALTFFSFLGFAVISFAAGDLIDPERTLPKAMYIALGATTALYGTIAICVFGTLPVADVVRYGPTAIAEAARPTLGDAGFTAMSIAALLATASSVTATLYASSGFTAALAEAEQFPPVFGRDSRLGHHGGLIVTTVLTLLFVVFFDLGALASIGSAVSLAVFVLVALAAFKLREEIGARVSILVAGMAACAAVLVVFVLDTLANNTRAFWATLGLVAAGIVMDIGWKRVRRTHRTPAPAPS